MATKFKNDRGEWVVRYKDATGKWRTFLNKFPMQALP